MYYIIETNYVGVNQDQHIDDDTVEISTAPAIYNSSLEICLDGWCGTTSDYAIYAHGDYPTIDAAREAVGAIFGDVRERNSAGDYYIDQNSDRDIVAIYRKGRYEPMSREHTGNWLYDSMTSDITVETSYDEIKTLLADYKSAATDEGCTLHPDAEEMMLEYRQQLIDDQDDD